MGRKKIGFRRFFFMPEAWLCSLLLPLDGARARFVCSDNSQFPENYSSQVLVLISEVSMNPHSLRVSSGSLRACVPFSPLPIVACLMLPSAAAFAQGQEAGTLSGLFAND
jgi:hypothetical protein